MINKIIKTSAGLLTTLLLANVAVAATPGTYAGLGIGSSNQNIPTITSIVNTYFEDSPFEDFTSTSTNHHSGTAGRIFAGYNFNKYLGVESGFTHYAQAQSTVTETDTFHSQEAKLTSTLNTVDLVGKAYLPLANSGLNLYGLAGIAFALTKNTLRLSDNETAESHFVNDSDDEIDSSKSYAVRPVVGLGASYDLNEHVSTNLEYRYLSGQGNLKRDINAIPSASLITLNIAYNFG